MKQTAAIIATVMMVSEVRASMLLPFGYEKCAGVSGAVR